MKTTHFGSAQWTLRLRSVSKALTLCIMFLSPLFWRGGGGEVFAQANGTGAGNCLSYNGVNQYVDISSVSGKAAGVVTISMWVKPFNNPPTHNERFIAQGQSMNGWPGEYMILYLMSQKIQFGRGNASSSQNTITSSSIVAANTWTHISVVDDRTNAAIYINGTLDAIVSSSSWVISSGSTRVAYFGTAMDFTNDYSGQIDEVSIWNTARTETEIRDNLCKKLTGNESGLVGYWRFDEGSGSTAYDASGNGNNGTLY